MRHKLEHIILVLVLSFSVEALSQVQNYEGINIQGQHDGLTQGPISIDFVLVDFANDTIWHERHSAVPVTAEGSYALTLGKGTVLGGYVALFSSIDWYDVQKIVSSRTGITSPYDLAEFNMISLPYAMHSLTIETIPTTNDLDDVNSSGSQIGHLWKYNGTEFYVAVDNLGDTSTFSYYGGTANYADTVGVGVSGENFADSTVHAILADTVNYADVIAHSSSADTAFVVDTAGNALVSIGNWRIDGNGGTDGTNFIGPTTNHALILGTNDQPRWYLDNGDNTYNSAGGTGFVINGDRGVLYTPSGATALQNFSDTYLYFDGQRSAFNASSSALFDLDTTIGQYSFAFGKNTATNGPYSTVFGENTFGDTAFVFGVDYAAISGFAFGKNCRTSYVGVAIGENCKANWYRNVAIGRNVTANTNSAGVGIGYNVTATGATAWGMGRNVMAIANFSTAMGSYASTGTARGSFVWGDASTTDTIEVMNNHSFVVRASGGTVIYTSSNLLTGVSVAAGGGSWNMISDRNKKTGIELLSPIAFKPLFTDLNVFSWNYLANPTRHVGPMAQDFFRLFGAGEWNTHINMLDIDGVTLVGIKMLKRIIEENEIEEEQLQATEETIENEKLEFEELENRIKTLYEKMD